MLIAAVFGTKIMGNQDWTNQKTVLMLIPLVGIGLKGCLMHDIRSYKKTPTNNFYSY